MIAGDRIPVEVGQVRAPSRFLCIEVVAPTLDGRWLVQYLPGGERTTTLSDVTIEALYPTLQTDAGDAGWRR